VLPEDQACGNHCWDETGDRNFVAALLVNRPTWRRLALQREVLDQVALMADPRTGERFARIEETARKNWGQT
jgi:hypothetical protein